MQNTKKIFNKSRENLKPVYLIYGEESLLLEEYVKEFIDNFIPEDVRDFNLTYIEDDNENFAKLLKNRLNTLPVMAEKRFIIASCSDYFQGKQKDDQIIINLLENFPESSILLIKVNGNIDKRIKINKIINKVGKIIEFKSPRYRNLDKWIKQEFAQKGKKVDKESVQLLEQMFNNHLQRLDSEIEKISVYNINKEEICYQDMTAVISKDRLLEDNVIFSFIDALSKRQLKEALILLNEMTEAGEYPLKILGNILWQVRLLLQVKVLKAEGNNPGKIAKILNQHPFPVEKAYKQCGIFSEEELELTLERFFQVNLDILHGNYNNDARMALEMALMEIL